MDLEDDGIHHPGVSADGVASLDWRLLEEQINRVGV